MMDPRKNFKIDKNQRFRGKGIARDEFHVSLRIDIHYGFIAFPSSRSGSKKLLDRDRT